jgi:PAS domain S-box
MRSFGPDKKSFEFSPIGRAIIHTKSGVIRSANGHYCGILGLSRESLVGKSLLDIIHPDDIIEYSQIMMAMLLTESAQSGVLVRLVCGDGTLIQAALYVEPILRAGYEGSHLVMVQDVTANARMRNDLKMRMHELMVTRESMLSALVVVAKFRDRETGEHLSRTKSYVRLILQEISRLHSFSAHGIEMIAHASMLHDIGKIGIPDSILLKQGPLTDDERQIMRTHTTLGAKALLETMHHLKGDASLMYAREIAETHHEWWNGAGYPHGLRGTEIPISGRVMAIADVYDALRSRRPYKDEMSHGQALTMLRRESGIHFDSEILAAFLRQEKKVYEISMQDNIE